LFTEWWYKFCEFLREERGDFTRYLQFSLLKGRK